MLPPVPPPVSAAAPAIGIHGGRLESHADDRVDYAPHPTPASPARSTGPLLSRAVNSSPHSPARSMHPQVPSV